MSDFFDPTFTMQDDGPSPRTVGHVLQDLGDNLYSVQFLDQRLQCRSAGNNPLVVGDQVSFFYFESGSWVCKADAEYPTRYPRDLADFAETHPASTLMLYLMQDNPKFYTYRLGRSLGAVAVNTLSVMCWDGETRHLPVEYAGVLTPASMLPVGTAVVCYQKADDDWVVIGRQLGFVFEDVAGRDISFMRMVDVQTFEYAVDPRGHAEQPVDETYGMWTIKIVPTAAVTVDTTITLTITGPTAGRNFVIDHAVEGSWVWTKEYPDQEIVFPAGASFMYVRIRALPDQAEAGWVTGDITIDQAGPVTGNQRTTFFLGISFVEARQLWWRPYVPGGFGPVARLPFNTCSISTPPSPEPVLGSIGGQFNYRCYKALTDGITRWSVWMKACSPDGCTEWTNFRDAVTPGGANPEDVFYDFDEPGWSWDVIITLE